MTTTTTITNIMDFQFLVSNNGSLKDRSLQNKENEISIIVENKDLFKKDPVLYPFRYGLIYDPETFRPINQKGAQKLPDGHIKDYYIMKDEAKQELENRKKLFTQNKDSDEIEELKVLIESKNSYIEDQRKVLDRQKDLLTDLTNKVKEKDLIIEELRNKYPVTIRHEKFDRILAVLKKGHAVYLYGSAGTGKSELAKQLSDELGFEDRFYPMSTITQEFKFTGFIDGNGKYHETNFYKAVKNGGVLFMDELDASLSDVLVGLNTCLAQGYFDFPHETVNVHKDFTVISAGNTIGRGATDGYEGRNALDISTLDRFLAISVEYSPEIDKAVAGGNMELVEFANSLRKASKETEIDILMSYRSIKRIKDFENEFDLIDVMDMSLIKGMASDDVLMLARNMNIDSKNKYYKAFKKAVQ